MKTYNKRIGFLVSYQTLVPHGGIGQFTKSFIRLMEENNVKVDIITDKKPQDNEFIKSLNTNIIYPEESYGYTNHSAIFMYGDSYCYERMANFRNSIIRALSTNLYDALICNTYETVQVASTMGLEHQLMLGGITIGTQSKFNKSHFDNFFDNIYELPIPITEPDLLKEHHVEREGVLFIGRWEEGKNPELYLKLIGETKLPARVMTNANGAKKFEARLKELNVDYKIAVSVIGQEKIDFITSCRVAFNPSTVESYGMAFYEQQIQLPTFVIEDQRWTENFKGHFFFETNKKDMAKDVLNAYDMFSTAKEWYNKGTLLYNQQKEAEVFDKWNLCFESFTPRQSNSNTAKILSYDTLVYADFIQDLGRKTICIDDVRSVLTNKSKYATVLYTDNHTILSKEQDYVPVVKNETNVFDDLFEFQ